jgi:hypothetical protein
VCHWFPSRSFISSCVLSLQLLSQGSADVPTLLAKVTRVREATAIVETACVTAVLATETSTHEAPVARDSAALGVKDAERLGHPSGEVGTGEGIESEGGERRGVSLCS